MDTNWIGCGFPRYDLLRILLLVLLFTLLFAAAKPFILKNSICFQCTQQRNMLWITDDERSKMIEKILGSCGHYWITDWKMLPINQSFERFLIFELKDNKLKKKILQCIGDPNNRLKWYSYTVFVETYQEEENWRNWENWLKKNEFIFDIEYDKQKAIEKIKIYKKIFNRDFTTFEENLLQDLEK